ncbi:MAG: carbon storage regulator [Planctomycetaceae bacterium]
MLVITRRVGEELIIDGHIRVLVAGIRGNRVRLGVSAPASVRVDRGEIHDHRPARSFPAKHEVEQAPVAQRVSVDGDGTLAARDYSAA